MMMDPKTIAGILKISDLSECAGRDERLDRIAGEIAALIGGEFPGKPCRLFIWDDGKRNFFTVSGEELPAGSRALAAGAAGVAHDGSECIVPLRSGQRMLGVLAVSSGGDPAVAEQIAGFGRLAEVLLSNAVLFSESERRGMDMFRFNVVSRALNPTVNEDDVLKILVEALLGMVKCDACGFLVCGKKEQTLLIQSKNALAGQALEFIEGNLCETVANLAHSVLRHQGLKRVLKTGEGVPDERSLRSVLNSPLITKGKVVGVVAVYGFEHDLFSIRDQRNLSLLSSHGAVAFENAMLYGDLKRTYFSIINALASAIEAKDEYTRGHSDLVSRYSVAIATAMQLSPSTIESIQIAGLLHDLGKIGVPEDILGKKGKLTDAEFDIVKAHPEIAMKILGPVEFPHFGDQVMAEAVPELTLSLFEQADLSADVKLMIFHHHEKFSGGGYPKGLVKDEIPLGARILSVADTFEALTADRPYRKAFSSEEAVKIVRELSGSQLDPEIVRVFAGLVESRGIDELRNMQGL